LFQWNSAQNNRFVINNKNDQLLVSRRSEMKFNFSFNHDEPKDFVRSQVSKLKSKVGHEAINCCLFDFVVAKDTGSITELSDLSINRCLLFPVCRDRIVSASRLLRTIGLVSDLLDELECLFEWHFVYVRCCLDVSVLHGKDPARRTNAKEIQDLLDVEHNVDITEYLDFMHLLDASL